jgi:hypothetical protein
LQSTQGTTQQDILSTSDLQDSNSANLQYDEDDLMEVSKSFEYDWQLTGHCFIGERVSMIYPNGLVGIGTVQKYLPPDGDDVKYLKNIKNSLTYKLMILFTHTVIFKI